MARLNDKQEEARGGRRGGRRRRAAVEARGLEQRPFGQLRNPYPPLRAVSDDELESLHQAALQILEEIGIEILAKEAQALFAAAGVALPAESERLRLERGLVEESVAKAPARFRLHARNPAHNLEIGGDKVAVCLISSPPNCSDLDGGRRPGNAADFRKFLQLGQSLNAVNLFGGYPVEPIDIHPSVRHLDGLADTIRLSDKVFRAYSLGRQRNLDAIEMARIARGVSDEQLDREPSLYTVVNVNSPLKLDGPMCQGIIEMARRNQPTAVTPFTLAGAMAPVTVAGALAQQHAEALAGLTLGQLANPGAPMLYGGFTSNVDMKSGAPAFGTPEYMKAAVVGGQLARRLGLPYRSSNVNAANSVDAQAAYESVFSLWGAIMGGGHLLHHGCGWLEGGLCASFEKVVLDADLIQMIAAFFDPLQIDEESLALDAIREVGPGGHFFGTEHTQARYRTAFYAPMLSDWRNFEAWSEAGAPDAARHANRLYKQLLEDYEAPPLESAVREELEAFVAKRKEEGGVPTDF